MSMHSVVSIKKVMNGYSLMVPEPKPDVSWNTVDYVFLTLDEVLNKVKEFYAE